MQVFMTNGKKVRWNNESHTFLFQKHRPEPWNAAHEKPSRRPADGRYGENPNRLYQHHQFQVVMKPSPSNIRALP